MSQAIALSPDDLLAYEIAQRIFAEESVLGKSYTHDELVGRHYRIKPVGPEEFLFSDKYAGRYGTGLYQKWKEDLIYVLTPENGVTEWILTGAIGLGKSTVAALAMAYKLYQLGCLRDPCRSFDLMADSGIVFGVYSLFKYKSSDDNYALLKTMVDGIPFFREQFPRPRHTSPRGSDSLSFPNRVSVIAGSTELHALGLNVLALLIDEVNFMREADKDKAISTKISQAQELYTASKRRLESRFQYRGTTPGLMMLISSRNAESSWLETHIQEVSNDSNVYISDYPLWVVKAEKMGYSGKRFFVEVGDAIRPSVIIDSPKDARDGARVISPPIEHREAFEKNIDGALRDIAGVANVNVSTLMKDKLAMQATINPKLSHPFTRIEFPISHLDDIPIQQWFLANRVLKIIRSFPQPLLSPGAPRFVHIDLSESGDATGIAMGHISSLTGTNPHITMDFVLRLLAPMSGQIDFSKIVDFVCYLSQHCGYLIKQVSFDRFQSTHARQILTKLGYSAPYYSVDKTDEAYLVLQATIYEARLSVYDYPPLFTELSRLLHNRLKRKVDHPDGGSKDVADAVAAVVAQLTKAMAEDPAFRSQTSEMIIPQHVVSLEERLAAEGAMASVLTHGVV